MKSSIILTVGLLLSQICFAGAQTTCLGVNCDSEVDRQLPDRQGYIGENSTFDQFIRDSILNDWLDDPRKQECIEKCNREFHENVLACADAHEGDISIFSGLTADACLEAAKRRLYECLPSPGVSKCL